MTAGHREAVLAALAAQRQRELRDDAIPILACAVVELVACVRALAAESRDNATRAAGLAEMQSALTALARELAPEAFAAGGGS